MCDDELQQYKVEMFSRFQFIENQISRLEAATKEELEELRTLIEDMIPNE